MSSKSLGSSLELSWQAAQQWCVYLQEQKQELTWQLGEAQRQIGEARRERNQLKADIEHTLQATKEAKVQIVLRTSRKVVDRCHFAKARSLTNTGLPQALSEQPWRLCSAFPPLSRGVHPVSSCLAGRGRCSKGGAEGCQERRSADAQ